MHGAGQHERNTAVVVIRREYVKPVLVRYGSLRNLTGGSGTNGRDGAVVRSRFTP